MATLVERKSLRADPAQAAAVQALDRIGAALGEPPANPLLSLFQRPKPIVGAYLVGAVGRGKTLLMDMFFQSVPIAAKRRLHFHEFMDEIHTDIAAFRAVAREPGDAADPVQAVVKPWLEKVKLLCLDEFIVQDITNAMLLDRLFTQLFAGGVVLVATSNTPPDRLYENGLNRQYFTPFIATLKRHVSIVTLDGPTDYRRLKFEGEAVYQFGQGPEVVAAMERLWLKLTGGDPGRPGKVTSLGRSIDVSREALGAARFPFAALCEAPLGARDYLRLAHAFDTIMVDGVPQFDRVRTDAAKRFILLIDTLYDRGVKLAASFAVPLDQLAGDDRTAVEFQRTVSRLIEMQSGEYLTAPRKAPASA